MKRNRSLSALTALALGLACSAAMAMPAAHRVEFAPTSSSVVSMLASTPTVRLQAPNFSLRCGVSLPTCYCQHGNPCS